MQQFHRLQPFLHVLIVEVAGRVMHAPGIAERPLPTRGPSTGASSSLGVSYRGRGGACCCHHSGFPGRPHRYTSSSVGRACQHVAGRLAGRRCRSSSNFVLAHPAVICAVLFARPGQGNRSRTPNATHGPVLVNLHGWAAKINAP